MSDPRTEVQHGLEGVVAFDTQIAEPDKEGSALRYRGVDIEDLVGRVPFENVWGLLVDGAFTPGLPPAEPFPLPVHTGDVRVDVQSALAMLAPAWGLRPLYDIDDVQAREDLSRAAVMALSYVAQAARGIGQPMVPQREVDKATTITERFMIRWRGEPDPKHVKAVDAYWTSAAEHGMNASTFTARVIASTGADVAAALSGAVGAMSGPLHGGAPARVLTMIEGVERSGDARAYVKGLLDAGDRLMGFGHRVYRAEDPRARVLRRTAQELAAPRYEVAEALEQAARTACWRPTSSSGRRSCWTSPKYRRRCSPRCSPAPAPQAGAPTSSSRSAPAASSAPPRSTPARPPAPPRPWKAGTPLGPDSELTYP
jgi:citrate synthase